MSGDEDTSPSSEGQPGVPDAKDKLYEPKKAKKLIRVLTVMAYVFSVSLAAIMLSLYYVFLWDPKIQPTATSSRFNRMYLTDPQPQYLVDDDHEHNISCLHHIEEVVALPQINDTTPTAPTDAAKFKSTSKMSLLNIMFPQLLSDTSSVSDKEDSILN